MARRRLFLGAAGVLGSLALAGVATAAVPVGDFDAAPLSGGPETVIAVESVTPCPNPGDSAVVELVNPAKKVVATKTFSTDAKGGWKGEIVVPADSPDGAYPLRGRCTAKDGTVDLLYRAASTFTVTPAGGGLRPPGVIPPPEPTTTAPPPPVPTTAAIRPTELALGTKPPAPDVAASTAGAAVTPAALPASVTALPVTSQPTFTG